MCHKLYRLLSRVRPETHAQTHAQAHAETHVTTCESNINWPKQLKKQ